MRKKGFSFSLMLGAGVLLLGTVGMVTSCSNGPVSTATVKLNKTSLSMVVGDTEELKVQASKEYVTAGIPVYWVSTNEHVAYVKDGHVFALGVGNCQIHVYIGGGRDVCEVTVTENGGGGEQNPYLRVSPTNKTIAVGGTFKLTYSAYPSGTTVEYSADASGHVSVGSDGTVTGVSAGTGVVTLTGSNALTATCTVTVNESGGGGGGPEYDIGVSENLGATGSFVIGSPVVYKDMTISLLKDFNKYTGSSITWEIKDFEENTAATNLTPDASLGPDVFPYASDQTQSLNTLNALARLGRDDRTWIGENMVDGALTAATLGAIGTVGYPFASDNSYVMFYDKSKVSDPSEINTVSKLFAKAAEYTDGRRSYRVSYDLGNGFYGGAALMSYTYGVSLYDYVPLSDGGYKSRSNFASEAGLKGAEALVNIYKQSSLDSTYMIPSDSTKTLATITDCSKVLGMKQTMGDKYAVAPLPFIDDDMTTRLGSFSGYKFYGVNNKKLGNDTAKKNIASAIAKFFVSEYAQHVRLETFGIRPTMKTLQDAAKDEPHVAALNEQAKDPKSAIALSVVDSTFWAQTGNACTDIKALAQAGEVTKAQLTKILEGLDSSLLHNWDS